MGGVGMGGYCKSGVLGGDEQDGGIEIGGK